MAADTAAVALVVPGSVPSAGVASDVIVTANFGSKYGVGIRAGSGNTPGATALMDGANEDLSAMEASTGTGPDADANTGTGGEFKVDIDADTGSDDDDSGVARTELGAEEVSQTVIGSGSGACVDIGTGFGSITTECDGELGIGEGAKGGEGDADDGPGMGVST